jgi:hypothetical protein
MQGAGLVKSREIILLLVAEEFARKEKLEESICQNHSRGLLNRAYLILLFSLYITFLGSIVLPASQSINSVGNLHRACESGALLIGKWQW